MKKRVELLAPAGNMQCFLAAVNAGADAVYMGGSKFGARAYADNFSDKELLEAIRYGHLFHRKIYLTLNTLLKDSELLRVVEYVAPFYEAGLDGVIIQDFGVLSQLKRYFPGMELHASTQMTVTGAKGAALLKEYGVCRIVPARELSLDEIKEIKKQVPIEIEAFIHGAMCYAYSGQCLFSSMLGGRSGNRGRCAGPCRLPYDVLCDEKRINSKKEQYLLSLKDMCTISLLPELIESGIDSFKIEGRMKSPEYVAGVTGIYRKYIDSYYANRENPSFRYQVAKEDLDLLRKLYVRSELETGYYKKHNGACMVTLNKPCYETGSRDELSKVAEKYGNNALKLPLRGKVRLEAGQPAELTIAFEENVYPQAVTIKGSIVQQALNRPLDLATVKKQLLKTGGTCFEMKQLDIMLGECCFLSMGELNDLRRQALDSVFDLLTKSTGRSDVRRNPVSNVAISEYTDDSNVFQVEECCPSKEVNAENNAENYHIVVNDVHQLEAVGDFLTDIVKGRNDNPLPVRRVSISCDLLSQLNVIKPVLLKLSGMGIALSLTFPRIVRRHTRSLIRKQLEQDISLFSAFVVGNLELLQDLSCYLESKKLYGDYSLYCFNSGAFEFLMQHGISRCCIPYEWSRHEIKSLKKKNLEAFHECIVYSYIPLMTSAGCVLKTTGNCLKEKADKEALQEKIVLADRYAKRFPVQIHCDRCENTIYNSVPCSLHKKLDELRDMGICNFRMDFTVEDKAQTLNVLRFFSQKGKREQPFLEFTNGHFGKGIE